MDNGRKRLGAEHAADEQNIQAELHAYVCSWPVSTMMWASRLSGRSSVEKVAAASIMLAAAAAGGGGGQGSTAAGRQLDQKRVIVHCCSKAPAGSGWPGRAARDWCGPENAGRAMIYHL